MKSLTLLFFTIALFNYAICEGYVELTRSQYSQEQTAVDSWNVGWQVVLKDGIDNKIFSAKSTWTDTSPSCIFKKVLDNGLQYYFLGHAKDEKGNVVNSLIFVDYNSDGPKYTYYSYFYKNIFANRYNGETFYFEKTSPDSGSAPETVIEDLAPQEEVNKNDGFLAPEVDQVKEDNGEVDTEAGTEENLQNEEVEVPGGENEEDPQILAGFAPIDLSTINDNNPQAMSALWDGQNLIVQNEQEKGVLVPGDWGIDMLVKAYSQQTDDGTKYYFAVTMNHQVEGFDMYVTAEYYVLQNEDGVNELQIYKIGDQWATSVPSI